MKPLIELVRQHRSFILFLFLMFAFRSAIADWNDVPTGSMKPTIIEGDRILVNKLAYDLRVPFSDIRLIHFDDPQRGDIVVFDSAAADKRLVKRVIGTPGDSVAMIDNQIHINGLPLQYKIEEREHNFVDALEISGTYQHKIRLHKTHISARNFNEVTVPDDYYLVLGDNRDRSADSRVIGFVPRDEIIGRSRYVVLSLDYDNFFMPRTARFFHRL